MRKLGALFFLFMLAGCAGVGVIASSDPLTKLNDAEDLYQEQDRPLIAERLIREAIVIYQERDDPHGLGNAHREYADLLRSRSIVGKWQTYYRQYGFQDTTVTFDNRLEPDSEVYVTGMCFGSVNRLSITDIMASFANPSATIAMAS